MITYGTAIVKVELLDGSQVELRLENVVRVDVQTEVFEPGIPVRSSPLESVDRTEDLG